MADHVATAGRRAVFGRCDARRTWLVATVCLTVVPIVALPWLAPSGSQHPAFGLGWVLFVGSSVHVASTGWFYANSEVRQHVRRHRLRFVAVPALLIVIGVGAATALPPRVADLVLMLLLGWQSLHFQKQNIGMCALAARSCRVPGPSRGERSALTIAAGGAVIGTLGHPQLLQIADAPNLTYLFPVGAVFGCAVASGFVLLRRRARSERPAAYVVVCAMSLLFFSPVWLFSSPYGAIAGLTIAHGLQYLLLMGLVAGGGPRGRQRTVSIVVLVDIALLAGLALNRMSHLHGGNAVDRVLFGCYLGLTAAHFVADAGLWRLRDAFPRQFLTRRLPYLLATSNEGRTM